MNLAALVPLVLKTSIALNVFCLGLESTASDITYFIRNPSLLIRSLLAMNVVMPTLAIVLALEFNLHPAVKIALIALALSPVPPKMPRKAEHAAGRGSYAIGLLVTVSVLSFIWVPVGVEAVGSIFGFPIHMGPAPIVALISLTILLPLFLGMLIARFNAKLTSRTVRALSMVSMVLLVVAVIPILFTLWRSILSLVATGTLISFLVFILVGLGAGHLLGWPNDRDRAVLAISSAFRHPGIAMAIAAATFPAQKSAPAAIILYLLAGATISQIYEHLMARHAGKQGL